MDNKNLPLTKRNGIPILFILLLFNILSLSYLIIAITFEYKGFALGISITQFIIYLFFSIIAYCGLTSIKPNEAKIYTLFGKYYGTIDEPGFYYINPFATNVSLPASSKTTHETTTSGTKVVSINPNVISLKEQTFVNQKQKVNDLDGNPIEISVVVIWKVIDPYKAIFNVDNYKEYLSSQCDGVIRNIARSYPYDLSDDQEGERSLRGSINEIVEILKNDIQNTVNSAGIEIIDAKISHLAYSIEIASAMLQRQQAKAMIDARTAIVEGAVGMVEMAIERLESKEFVHLDEERKAQMVSNLLVVLCSSKETTPIVNSGNIY